MAYFGAPYSAISAISPAFDRTRQFLFRPFRFWRFLKLALVAALVEGVGASFNFGIPPSGGKTSAKPTPMPHFPWPPTPMMVAWIAAGVLVLLVLSVVISYLLIRLRFAYFDCVLTLHDEITPGWRKYPRQAMRYLGMNLCIGAGALVIVGSILLWMVTHFRLLWASAGPERHISPGELVPFVLGTIIGVFVLVLVMLAINTAMSYFMLPRMAIEDSTILDALDDVWSDIKVEPGQFVLFMLMRLLLPAAAMMVAIVVLLIPMVVLIAVAVLVSSLLREAIQPGSILFFAVLDVVVVIIGIGIFLPAGIAIGGTIGTFVRNYALLFYGGRYPALGQLLWSPMLAISVDLPPEPGPLPG